MDYHQEQVQRLGVSRSDEITGSYLQKRIHNLYNGVGNKDIIMNTDKRGGGEYLTPVYQCVKALLINSTKYICLG